MGDIIQELNYTADLLLHFVMSGKNLNLSLEVDELVLVLGLLDGLNHRGVSTGKEIRNYDIYDIERLKKKAEEWGFQHFEDKDFIRECILFGYRHHRFGEDHHHDPYLLEHVSHVFIKKFNQ